MLLSTPLPGNIKRRRKNKGRPPLLLLYSFPTFLLRGEDPRQGRVCTGINPPDNNNNDNKVVDNDAPINGDGKVLGFNGEQNQAAKNVINWSRQNGLPPDLVLSMAKGESGFNPHARNDSSIENSYGLFQVNTRAHGGTKETWEGPDGAVRSMEEMKGRWKSAFDACGGDAAWKANPEKFFKEFWPKAQGCMAPSSEKVSSAVNFGKQALGAYTTQDTPPDGRIDETNNVTPPPDNNNGAYTFPVAGYPKGSKISTHWGTGERGGTDIFGARGTPIQSIGGGQVMSAGYDPTGGNYVMIKGDDGRQYYYCHLDQAPSVKSGQRVDSGQQIGALGDSGNAKGTGCHLHLGIGDDIQSGRGAQGGCGTNFDAVTFLQNLING